MHEFDPVWLYIFCSSFLRFSRNHFFSLCLKVFKLGMSFISDGSSFQIEGAK